MPAPEILTGGIPSDLTLSGPRAKPDYGQGATFTDKGDIGGMYDRERVEKVFQGVFAEAERYRLTFEPEWVTEYQQFHGETSDPGKGDWQSQVHVPKSAQAINTATARIMSVIFGQEDWFGTKSSARSRDDMVEMARKMVLWQFDKASAEDGIGQSIKNALICGNGPMKVHVASSIIETIDTQRVNNKPVMMLGKEVSMGTRLEFVNRTKAVKQMRFESVIPTDYWMDPSGLKRFRIHRFKRQLSDLWALARDQKGDDGKTIIRKAIYDSKVVEMVQPGARDSRLDNQAAIIKRDRSLTTSQQQVDVYEFWGDLIDPNNGVTIFRNIIATFVNKQWCIRMPERNPLLFATSPFIEFKALMLPNQIYGYGLLAQAARLQFEMDRVLQAMVDKVHLSVSMLEMDPSALRKPEEAGGGKIKVVPGKVWIKKAGDRKIFNRVEGFEPPNEWEIQLYQIIRGLFEETTGVNEWVTGAQQSTVRKTKSEVELRANASQQSFNESAQYIESSALSPMVNLVYQLMLQFEDEYDDPELLSQFEDQPAQKQLLMSLPGMTLEERWNALRVTTEFKVDGVTRDITRQNVLQRLQSFLAMIQADPTLSGILDKSTLLRLLLQNFDLPNRLVLGQADAMIQSAEEQARQPQPLAEGQGGGAVAPAAPSGAAPFDNSHNRASALSGRANAAATGQRPQ